jgi:hypothetical protein
VPEGRDIGVCEECRAMVCFSCIESADHIEVSDSC